MINRAETVAMTSLLAYMPTWMVDKVAERPPEQIVISYDSESGLFITSQSDKEEERTFPDMSAAYKYAYAMKTSKYEILFSRSILENRRITVLSDGGEYEDGASLTSVFWLTQDKPKSSSVMYSSRVWATRVRSNVEDLEEAHLREEAWKADPSNIILCHDFIRNHPAVWQHHEVEGDELNGYWETASLEAYTTDIWSGEEIGYPEPVVFHLEGHIRNDDPASHKMSPFAFNPALTADGATFEEAIVILANLFYIHYDCCGNERAATPNGTKAKKCKWSQRPQATTGWSD